MQPIMIHAGIKMVQVTPLSPNDEDSGGIKEYGEQSSDSGITGSYNHCKNIITHSVRSVTRSKKSEIPSHLPMVLTIVLSE